MAIFVKVLGTGIGCRKTDKDRIWIKPAEPIVINDEVYVALFFDRIDDNYVPLIMARSRKGEACVSVPSDSYSDFVKAIGVTMIPVAIEYNSAGMATRMMVDIFHAQRIEFREAVA